MSVAENPVRVRTARPYDAAALLDLKRQLDEETAFMMWAAAHGLHRLELTVMARNTRAILPAPS